MSHRKVLWKRNLGRNSLDKMMPKDVIGKGTYLTGGKDIPGKSEMPSVGQYKNHCCKSMSQRKETLVRKWAAEIK